ncbi:hypothetical protein [Sphingomonas sp. LM7]|uniref:cupredoxin domain-containing protein n=1 Tax=Sphingomonas sp. LM7 TaxID=1938607 RepID=UPI000983D0B2|nr:hypothetical protein [Sphingomonas sp. LM7]AQR74517.1 hypothetical protein BXU08_13400 [Sphingomonas sp. LM7]
MRLSSWTRAAVRHPIAMVLSLLALGALGWAALAPIAVASHDAVYEIPRGTYAHRAAGEKVDIFPQTIRLRLGLKDVLVLKNADEVPHIFGPTLIMPGQSFRLPFETASTYSFECTAHPHGGLHVIVEPGPAPGLERLLWRWHSLISAA